MKKLLSVFLCLFLLLPVGISAAIIHVPETEAKLSGGEPLFDGYIVKVGDEASRLFAASQDLRPLGGGLYLVSSPEDASMLPGEIDYIEPNYILHQLGGPGEGYTSSQWSLNAVKAYAAWQMGLFGQGVKVALIDSGLNTSHEDLVYGNILPVIDFTGDGKTIADTTGHGTAVGGVIAAAVGNSQSPGTPAVDGAASGVTILPLRIFSTAKTSSVSVVVAAINYAVQQECDVINISAGMLAYSETLKQACDSAAKAGALVVSAAGNWGGTAYAYPASYDSVISVAAVEDAGSGYVRAGFSQINDRVFVTAPGHDITSLGKDSADDYVTGKEGTSYSAPLVAALAALAKQQNRSVDIDGFRSLLITTSKDLGKEGKDSHYGWGMIDFEAFAHAITRQYTVTLMNPEGIADWPHDITFSFGSRNPVALPQPPSQGGIFAGWRLDSAQGAPITQIDPISARDYTLYPSWSEELGATVKVCGYQADFDSDSKTFFVTLPLGTAVAREDISIIPTGAGAAAVGLEQDDDDLSGSTWIFTVTGPAGASVRFRLVINVSGSEAPALKDAAEIWGRAVPSSLDGLVAQLPFEFSPGDYFTGDSLSFAVSRQDGAPAPQVGEDGKFIYSPAPGDYGSVVFYIAAHCGAFASPPLTVTVTVAARPASNSGLGTENASLDIFRPQNITVPLTLYDNTLQAIYLIGPEINRTLAVGRDYSLMYSAVDGQDAAVISGAALARMAQTGENTLEFAFSAGKTQQLKLKITDSAPRYSVIFKAFGNDTYYALSNIRAGSKISLPKAPVKKDHAFAGWYTAADGGGAAFTANDAVNSDMLLYAKWAAAPSPQAPGGTGGGVTGGGTVAPVAESFAITATAGEGGTVSPSSATATKGASVTVTVKPNLGYQISRLLADGAELALPADRTAPYEYRFANITASHILAASFEKIPIEDTAAQQLGFNDVDENAWYFEAVRQVCRKGLMTGASQGSFAP